MRIIVERSSNHGYVKGQPCDEAQPLGEYSSRYDEDPAMLWYVEFKSLEDLLQFCKTHGAIILFAPKGRIRWSTALNEYIPEHDPDWFFLEIYDNWRE